MPRTLLMLVCALWLGIAGGAPVVVADDSGQDVRLAAPAARIISLSPGLTELLFQIGAGDRVIAVDQASDFPPAVQDLPKVGTVAGIDLERVLALRPDLVLVWKESGAARLVQWLRDAGIPVYVSSPQRLDQIATTLQRLGRLSGHEPRAVAQAQAFRHRLAQLRARYRRAVPLTVFYQVWNDPLITVNGDQFISELIQLCGGVNVFAALEGGAPRISVEAVLARDPQVMVAGVLPGQGDPLAMWRQWPALRAVRSGALLLLPADLMQRPSTRLLDGAALLCQGLQQITTSEATPHR